MTISAPGNEWANSKNASPCFTASCGHANERRHISDELNPSGGKRKERHPIERPAVFGDGYAGSRASIAPEHPRNLGGIRGPSPELPA
jgi:hypothetical protein